MRAAALFLTLIPALAVARPNGLSKRQDEAPIDVPEGPLPPCSAACFGRWGWPVTLCTGQEGLNHLIECFYDLCETEQLRIHAQLAAEQNCEEGMGWPDRQPEDIEYSEPNPPETIPEGWATEGDDDEDEEEDSSSATTSASGSATPTSGSASSTGSGSASATNSAVATGTFDAEGSEESSEPENGALRNSHAGYLGLAAAAFGALVAL